ncbi:MAG: hypothetical protein SGI88_10675 [Candidatus Hydrogenedentes bacterium]|nr:hypothetical protein [Candidatus Hydrogenedentota bacterium]
MTSSSKPHSPAFFVLFPAVAMLLGWGLRGYIGGGPFGALIPGVYVALCLSLLLKHDVTTAATVAMFGALGIGYGGDMTYGQTLGLAKDIDTRLWGFLGVTLKGTVWGLLGGAVLGVGLTRQHYDRKTLMTAFLITIVGFYLGWKLINEPKLIYFSNPLDKPREESWAGLTFAAIGLLAYLRTKLSGEYAAIPLRFALWGALGGGLGFGGGTLWLVYGPALPVPQKWFGWWKAMEFSFGFSFGAFLGLCAYLNRGLLIRYSPPEENEDKRDSWLPTAGLVAFIVLAFVTLPILFGAMERMESGMPALAVVAAKDFARMVGSFIFFAAVCFFFGLRSTRAAWQIAITLTFFHAMLDLLRDMTDTDHFGYIVPTPMIAVLLVISTVLVGFATAYHSKRERPLQQLFLLIIWTCYAVATWRTFGSKDLWFPGEDGGGGWAQFIADDAAVLPVHALFTVSALVTTWWIITKFKDETQQRS